MRVLICDDDTVTLRILEFQFRKDGFEVFKAVTGKEAQKILAENNDIDLLLTDLYMPSMHGLELLTYIRKTLCSNIPIVVVSREKVEENVLNAFELGANDYLTKPFDLADLSNRVKNLIKNDKND